MRRQFNRSLILGVVVAVLAAGAHWAARERAKSRDDLREFADLISLGDTSNEVVTAFKERRSSYLSLFRESVNLWRFETPLEFGATNWKVIIAFDSKGRVVAIGFRTEDSDRMHPTGAPDDRITPGHLATWASRFK